jgi:hypothetical protein
MAAGTGINRSRRSRDGEYDATRWWLGEASIFANPTALFD